MTNAFVNGGMAARILGGVLRIGGVATRPGTPQVVRSALFGVSLALAASLGMAQAPTVGVSTEAAIRIFSEGQRLNQQELAAAQGRMQAKSTESTASVTATSTGSVTRVPTFRFYNTQTGAHFYTISVTERNHVQASLPHMTYEGVAFEVSSTAASGLDPVYRFFGNPPNFHSPQK